MHAYLCLSHEKKKKWSIGGRKCHATPVTGAQPSKINLGVSTIMSNLIEYTAGLGDLLEVWFQLRMQSCTRTLSSEERGELENIRELLNSFTFEVEGEILVDDDNEPISVNDGLGYKIEEDRKVQERLGRIPTRPP